MNKLIITVVLILALMSMGFTWKQVTPTDKSGCAGYQPSDYDNPSEDYSEIYSPEPKHNNSGWDNSSDWDDSHGMDSDVDYYEPED